MVALENCIRPQEGSKKQNSPSFLPASQHKFGHNSAIVGSTGKWFASSCSSRDSESGDISIINIFQNGEPHVKG